MIGSTLQQGQADAPVPRLLLTTTVWWPSVALLAVSFERAGFKTTLLCPKGHPGWTARISQCLELSATRPLQDLSDAIASSDPILIVPADDRAVSHLHALHANTTGGTRRLIERSLGPSWTYPITLSRIALLAVAHEAGVPTPVGQSVASFADVDSFIKQTPGPWVLKMDGSWGGQGVRVVDSVETAQSAYRLLTGVRQRLAAVKRLLINRDPFCLADWQAGKRPQLSMQCFVKGQPGNLALFCVEGEVKGYTFADVESCSYDTGPSTFIRVVERPDLLEQARRLIGKLGLSGFVGLDYMVDGDTGQAILIEMNPRITALCNIRFASPRDPISAASSFLLGLPAQVSPQSKARTLYAHFPIAWHAHPNDPRLSLCDEDVPWAQPELVAEGLKPPWHLRGALARAYAGCNAMATMIGRRRNHRSAGLD